MLTVTQGPLPDNHVDAQLCLPGIQQLFVLILWLPSSLWPCGLITAHVPTNMCSPCHLGDPENLLVTQLLPHKARD